MELGPRVIFEMYGIKVTETVCFAWLISILLIIFAFFATRKMKDVPKGAQLVGELIVETFYNLVIDVMGKKDGEKFAPYIGTLLLFLGLGSALGLLDLRPVTADLNTTIPLALVSFIMIHYCSIKARTFPGYIRHMSSPYAFMLPLNIISECMVPVTLGCRIFGNITAGVILMTLIYNALEYLSGVIGLANLPVFMIALPLPLNFFFDMFEPFLQAYIFSMLTMVYIANGKIVDEE